MIKDIVVIFRMTDKLLSIVTSTLDSLPFSQKYSFATMAAQSVQLLSITNMKLYFRIRILQESTNQPGSMFSP